jgi:omega-6 fatty acid desaturase (delta-12 desaturase)
MNTKTKKAPSLRKEKIIKETYPKTLDGPRKAIRAILFKPNTLKAILMSAIGISFHLISYIIIYYALSQNNNILLVIGWFIAGTSVTSLFVLGHDCAHSSFLKNNKWNDILGHFYFLFSFYPYYAWKYSHNAHHAHTNQLFSSDKDIYFDNAWLPFTVDEYFALKKNSPTHAFIYKLTRYFPPFGSLLHNIVFQYFPSKYIPNHRKKLVISYTFLFFGILGLSMIFYKITGNLFSIFHFLIIPALIFQFWMSYYTYLHHTATNIKFYNKKDWTPYIGQIVSTYNCLNPKIISFLHFHIDIHTPHHISTAIPCYNLPEAYNDLLKSEYAKDLKQGAFKFSYLFNQMMNCHLWDEKEEVYITFKQAKLREV